MTDSRMLALKLGWKYGKLLRSLEQKPVKTLYDEREIARLKAARQVLMKVK